MNEALNLHILRNVVPDFLNLLKRKLSGRYHSLSSLIIPEPVGQIVGIVGLCRNMPLDFRALLHGYRIHAGVRDDEGVGLKLLKLPKVFPGSIQVVIVRQNIGGYIYLLTSLVSIAYAFCHIFMREVLGLGTQTEGLSSYIYGIRSVFNCHLQHLKAVGGNQ